MMFRIQLLIAVLFIVVGIASTPTHGTGAERPNVVWLISEDNSMHYLEHFFPGGATTPNIVSMASHGLTYRHAFSTAPVCSVARTTLITGCYAPRIGTQYHRRSISVPMPLGLKMFPAYLKEAGYYTTNREKKDYNANETAGTWDESSSQASWKNRAPDQPFFHMQSFTTTHESSLHFSEQDLHAQTTTTDPQAVPLAPYHPDTPLFRYTAARYRDRVQQVDQQIGEVLNALAADGLLENTFVFYFGDHGGVLPRGKGYAYESGLHVPLVVRIPENYRALVDVPFGSKIDGFVSFVDFGPTVLNLAQAPFPRPLLDGAPFLGEGTSTASVNQRQSAFGYADRFDEKYDLVRTLRIGKYEYVRNFQPFNMDGLNNNYRYQMAAYREWRQLYRDGKLNATQSQFFQSRPVELLFDVETDPHEVNNLATNPAYATVLVNMRRSLQERLQGLPDLSFYPESFLADEAFKDPVGFGKSHQAEIRQLIDLANLQLKPWVQAEDQVREAIASSNPWNRYWGWIVASSFGSQAKSLVDSAVKTGAHDDNLLVRTRAAEFLGLIDAGEPRAILEECIRQSQSGIEAGLILNTVALLHDAKPGFAISLNRETLPPEILTNDVVQRRLEYLIGMKFEAPAKKNKNKKKQKDAAATL